ncbi:MAG: hypothetical protein RR911_03655 [Oscillospiraceae bacterium]
MDSNDLIRSSTKKIFMTVFTQVVILILSVITGFILPQKMGPDNYGYWQVYLFYLAYINVFGLGFNDGLALFYGGYEYKNLPFKKIRSAMKLFYIYLIIITVVGWSVTLLIENSVYQRIYQALVLNIPITCIQCVILTTFLAVNKTGIYNIVNILLKVLSVVFYIFLLASNIISPIKMIYADLIARTIITVICMILGREFLFGKALPFREGINELKEKSYSGFKITIAIIASMIIPVLGRTIIEANETITTYGIYSFSMSLLTIIMTFTTTAGLVVFPLLKRLRENVLPNYYVKFAFICDSLIYLALIAYIPLLLIVKGIMIEYIPSLNYLYILLAMCLPLGKMQLLITPYYKAFRMEKQFLIANILGVASMFVITFAMYKFFDSITAVAICTTVVLTLWTFATEFYLSKKKNIEVKIQNTVIQAVMMLIFIISGYFKDPLLFVVIYLPAIVIYFIYNRQKIKGILKQLKHKGE